MLRSGLGQDHQELVAADTTGNVDVSQGGSADPGDFDQRPVTGGMTEAIVDRLEAIDVEHDQGQRMAMALHPSQFLTQPFQYMAPIGQAGQRIGVCQLLELLPKLDHLGDVR